MQFNQGLRNALLTLFTLKGLIQSNLNASNITLMTPEIIKQIKTYGEGYTYVNKGGKTDKLTNVTDSEADVNALVKDYVKYLVIYPISISGALEADKRTMDGKLDWRITIKGVTYPMDSGLLTIIGKYRSGKTTLLNNMTVEVNVPDPANPKVDQWIEINKELLYLNEPDHQSALFNVDLINAKIVENKHSKALARKEWKMTTVDSLSSAENFVEGTLKKGGVNTGLLVLLDELNYHGHDWPVIVLANWDIPLSEIHGRCPNTLFVAFEGDKDRSAFLYRRSVNETINFKL